MTNDRAVAEIGIVTYPGAQLGMIHGLSDLFRIASELSETHGGERLRVSHWERADDGFRRSFDTMPDAGSCPAVLVVPGALSKVPTPQETEPYARWLLDRHAQGATLGSVCGGAFILAATGLLAGRTATTHWLFAEPFRRRFPDVNLDADKMIVEDGDIITAGGLMAWTDLGLRLVDRFLGPSVMLETAQYLLVDPVGREQRHYSTFAPQLTHGDEAILKVQHWLQAKGGRDVSVSAMAEHAGMEERTFLRRFRSATGMKPTEYCQQLRVGKARELLEFSKRPVDRIAWEVGYEDAGAFRKVFQKRVGLTPGDYRRRFGAAAVT